VDKKSKYADPIRTRKIFESTLSQYLNYMKAKEEKKWQLAMVHTEYAMTSVLLEKRRHDTGRPGLMPVYEGYRLIACSRHVTAG
jgi:hypothetical protein